MTYIVLDVWQEYIPEYSDHIDKQDSKGWRNQGKVDILGGWPNTPVKLEASK